MVSHSSNDAPRSLMTGPFGAIRSSFRAKLFAVTATVVIVVSTAFTLFSIERHHRAAEDKLVTEGRLLARLLARNARLPLFAGDREGLREVAEGGLSLPEVLAITFFDRDGRPAIHLARPAGLSDPAPEAPVAPLASPPQSGMRRGTRRIEFFETVRARTGGGSEEELFYSAAPEPNTGASLGTVRVVLDEEPMYREMHRLIVAASLAAAAFLALGSAAVFLVIRGITRPLTRLTEGVRAIEGGEKGVSIPVESDDEIGSLAAAFNRMVDTLRERELEREEAAQQIGELNVRLEERVRERTAQLEEANRELESFNYSASHDLRAPLMRLNGLCRALGEDCAEQLDENGRHYLRRIEAVGGQMERVVSAMSTLFNVQRREMRLQSLDLSAVVRAVAAALRDREPEREVTVVAEPEVTVRGDAELLWVAMENLVGNAWKFTVLTPGARIEFGRLEREGEEVLFVRDNGAGFDMAYAGKLFQPFQRLHAPEDFPGTGVGLAIVHRIITRHGGRIWLESAEGRGTTCFFTLAAPRPHENGGSP